MSKQIITVLILALLASVGGWLLLSNQTIPQPDAGVLFSDIGNYANSIDEVIIENSEGVVVQAKRMTANDSRGSDQTFPIQASEVESQRWFIIDAANSQREFAADQTKLGVLVSALVRAKLIEPKTSQPDKHERLGLKSIDLPDSQAVKVWVKSQGKEWQVLIGKEASSGSGFYLRKPQDNQTWLTDQKFDIEETQSAWLNRALFDFSAGNVRAIRRLDEEQWTIEKNDNSSNEFQLVDRQDISLKYDSVLNTYAESAVTLSFDGLKEMDPVFWDALKVVVELELETFAGDKYQLSLAENESGQYLKIVSTMDADFWVQWLFEVSNYTKTQLNKFHGDFLNDEAPTKGQLNE